ncbi:MAG: uracil phosphoribosyltransferase [Pirellulaceae bacterium]|nr:uracil phosphoribosyltransferase [Pirellulaceae bacterium]
MTNVNELIHPLAAHHLTILRDVNTPASTFRGQVQRLSMLLAVYATTDLPLRPKQVTTPLVEHEGKAVAVRVAIVPILRAGLAMVEPVLQLLPEAEVRHLGMYRDEATAQPVEYYRKLPDGDPADVALILDPMLATGGSIRMAVDAMKRWGVKDIRVLSLIAAPEGIALLHAEAPEVQLFVASVDTRLNADKFIVPGLGDAGDRIFNTSPHT